MESTKLRNVLVITMCAAFAFVIAGCIAAVVAVISDLSAVQGASVVLVFEGLAALALCAIGALLCRMWLIALTSVGALAVSLAVCLLSGILIGAGQHHPYSKAASRASSEETFLYSEIETDSLGVDMMLRYDLTDAKPLVQRCLSDFVARQLFFAEDGETAVAAPSYGGDLKAFFRDCVRQKWEELRDATFSTPGETGEDSEIPSAEEESEIPSTEEDSEIPSAEEDSEIPSAEELLEYMDDDASLSSGLMELHNVYETDSLVSWTSRYEVFVQGSAQPSYRAAGITIRKADGIALGHQLLKNTDSAAFRSLQKEGLRQWACSEFGEESLTDDGLREYLFGDGMDLDALPLPEQSPYLTEEGVALPYQENELIFCSEPVIIVLPYDEARDFLNVDK